MPLYGTTQTQAGWAVLGGPQLLAVMRALPGHYQEQYLRAALRRVGRRAVDEIKASVKRLTHRGQVREQQRTLAQTRFSKNQAVDARMRKAVRTVNAPRIRAWQRHRKGGKRKRLDQTVNMRLWKPKRSRQIAGVVVGPEYPAGAHGHLVEFGHRIVPRKHGRGATYSERTAKWAAAKRDQSRPRTRAIHFQKDAMRRFDQDAARIINEATERFLKANLAKIRLEAHSTWN